MLRSFVFSLLALALSGCFGGQSYINRDSLDRDAHVELHTFYSEPKNEDSVCYAYYVGYSVNSAGVEELKAYERTYLTSDDRINIFGKRGTPGIALYFDIDQLGTITDRLSEKYREDYTKLLADFNESYEVTDGQLIDGSNAIFLHIDDLSTSKCRAVKTEDSPSLSTPGEGDDCRLSYHDQRKEAIEGAACHAKVAVKRFKPLSELKERDGTLFAMLNIIEFLRKAQ